MSDKEQMRLSAEVLVKLIFAWGGQGKDIAEFLGVSRTTISHWKSLGELEYRKPAIPTRENIHRLLAILLFRMQQNLSQLAGLIDLGVFEDRLKFLVASTVSDALESQQSNFAAIVEEQTEGRRLILETVENLENQGQLKAFGTLFDPQVGWGVDGLNGMPPPDREINADEIRAYLARGDGDSASVEALVQEYQEMLIMRARSVLLAKKNPEKPTK